MRYLCLIYRDEKTLDALPKDTFDALVAEHLDYGKELARSGHFIASQALQSVATATTLRVRSGRLSPTDGPFAETKEQLGGFYLIEAKDFDEAVQLAAKIPSVRLGSVEVRPIRDCSQR